MKRSAQLEALEAFVGVWNIEGAAPDADRGTEAPPPLKTNFRAELMEILAEPQARRFAIFIFVSMLAYSSQDLILEPFAGAVFGMTPGATTKLAGFQHTGTLIGMTLVPLFNYLVPAWRTRTTLWIVGACTASALSPGCFDRRSCGCNRLMYPLRATSNE